ncbi:uncharacterized protein BYT42DRAFT_559651 [Radiomyces spectabilis]|uniref:uncharacterized protein n=1 Tax=Radiomyces spectabilis TaxID=64574 RepID=UPI0022204843|nr:uncharacterized protein BYT42DRAFT_559651 [Radiomyces spectabilis]KAI8388310.1 hypothetical protein BYT42DRAFT_559651 [Radiomyces spectabilis]
MELSICLYCEKRLANDSMNFCSGVCQAKEASNIYVSDSHEHNIFHPSSYTLSYHRRQSFSYPSPEPRPKNAQRRMSCAGKTRPVFLLPSMSSSSSSSMSDLSEFSTASYDEQEVNTSFRVTDGAALRSVNDLDIAHTIYS